MTDTLEKTLAAYDIWLDRQPLAAKTRVAVIPSISWRICIINLAHDRLEKRIQTFFKQSFSRITWFLRNLADQGCGILRS